MTKSDHLTPPTASSCGYAMVLKAGVEHRPDLGLALESGPVLAVQLHELGRDPDCFGFRVDVQDRR